MNLLFQEKNVKNLLNCQYTDKKTFKQLKMINDFNTPVVVLTADAIKGVKEKYLSVGFDDYLSKPIDVNELSTVLKKHLNK